MLAPKYAIDEGDVVALATDPLQERGRVVKVDNGSVYVTWPGGRTWFYRPNALKVMKDDEA